MEGFLYQLLKKNQNRKLFLFPTLAIYCLTKDMLVSAKKKKKKKRLNLETTTISSSLDSLSFPIFKFLSINFNPKKFLLVWWIRGTDTIEAFLILKAASSLEDTFNLRILKEFCFNFLLFWLQSHCIPPYTHTHTHKHVYIFTCFSVCVYM